MNYLEYLCLNFDKGRLFPNVCGYQAYYKHLTCIYSSKWEWWDNVFHNRFNS